MISRDSLKGARERIRIWGNFSTSAFNVETLTIKRRQSAWHIAVKREKRFLPENIKRLVTSKVSFDVARIDDQRIETFWKSITLTYIIFEFLFE